MFVMLLKYELLKASSVWNIMCLQVIGLDLVDTIHWRFLKHHHVGIFFIYIFYVPYMFTNQPDKTYFYFSLIPDISRGFSCVWVSKCVCVCLLWSKISFRLKIDFLLLLLLCKMFFKKKKKKTFDIEIEFENVYKNIPSQH